MHWCVQLFASGFHDSHQSMSLRSMGRGISALSYGGNAEAGITERRGSILWPLYFSLGFLLSNTGQRVTPSSHKVPDLLGPCQDRDSIWLI